jgi:hypothetical protein
MKEVQVGARHKTAAAGMLEEELPGGRARTTTAPRVLDGQPRAGQRHDLVGGVPRHGHLDEPGVTDPLGEHVAGADGLAGRRNQAIARLQLESDTRTRVEERPGRD